jgi:predicted nucleic acid-binding protein
VPNLAIITIDENLAEQAAVLHKKHKAQIGDSIHLATAMQQKSEAFSTNNELRSFLLPSQTVFLELALKKQCQ